MSNDPQFFPAKQRFDQPARAVTPQEIRDALFTARRPVVKPLFEPTRPVGPRYQPTAAQPGLIGHLRRLLGF